MVALERRGARACCLCRGIVVLKLDAENKTEAKREENARSAAARPAKSRGGSTALGARHTAPKLAGMRPFTGRAAEGHAQALAKSSGRVYARRKRNPTTLSSLQAQSVVLKRPAQA